MENQLQWNLVPLLQPELLRLFKLEKNLVNIFDTTLRDGEQTPGISLKSEEKLTIAKQLDLLGVDAIEAGCPISSSGELESVKMIANYGLKAKIYALSRIRKEDLDSVLDSDVKFVHMFIATSDLHLKHKLKMSREEAILNSLEMIDYAKKHGLIIEFSAEDATRTDLNYLKKFYKEVSKAGVDSINIPDTVGIMLPKMMYTLVSEVLKCVNIPISIHCHNDFGMAVANTLAGIDAGACRAHVTMNGLGERAGNAALEEVVLSLELLHKRKTNVNPKLIYQTSRLVSRITGILVQPNKAIVGENAFVHESGIHIHGLISEPLTYEPIPPEFVGRKRILTFGKHSGIHGLKAELEDSGFFPDSEKLNLILSKVKELANKGKIITDTDLLGIARDILGDESIEKQLIKLTDLAVMTGMLITPTASVGISIDDKIFKSAETGVGPVDAAIKAIQKIAGDLVDVRIKEYKLEALTGGSDALAEVIIKVEDSEGNIASARCANKDIVMASVNAMINGMNRLIKKK